jgi:hypothetical protein
MRMTCYQIVVYCNVAYEATTINYGQRIICTYMT